MKYVNNTQISDCQAKTAIILVGINKNAIKFTLHSFFVQRKCEARRLFWYIKINRLFNAVVVMAQTS